ncbi:malto-oligosyltrehalose trehalohydrolase [Cupriavidus sp. UYPR2.512]|uniref:malto-oligosyltrehalose trehalohydrolase n=1 Tax=Cupriavidus sp. UYPR2.512 TaxID=1080187 RepID=UPI00039B63ED|nr:malto-oligosyltrehalose trehalohydrolase [Cupriavidus sp. UYPR2.512]
MHANPFLLAPGARSAMPSLAPHDCFAAPAAVGQPGLPGNGEPAHDYLFGPAWLPDGRVRFRLWAPDAAEQGQAVRLEIAGLGPVHMAAGANGWFEAIVPCSKGARYWFRLDDGTTVPDPASRWQADDVHGPSIVPAPDAAGAFAWACPDWRGRPWHEAIVYEMHVGLCGGFAGVARQLPRLAALGFTAVELMPLAEFPGTRNWGYDGVLPFAPESAYGTPDELRALVDRAHQLGMMVLLDVVYNHFGPEGNYLHRYASAFFRADRQTPWGPAIDFRRPQVRRFFTENARYWLEQFRFDGLRLDAVHAIEDEGWLAALPGELRTMLAEGDGASRHLHLVLENDNNDAALLATGYDAQWNDDAHHALHVLLTGEGDGYYSDYTCRADEGDDAAAGRGEPALRHLARVLGEGFAYQGELSAHRSAAAPGVSSTAEGVRRGQPSAHLPPTAFVCFLQNHDQTGNRALGDRLAGLADRDALRAAVALQLLCPQVPLVFMGEETGTQRPFLYFTSHPPELAQAVRDGRRREFAASAAFRDDARAAAIPDPNDPATFEASRPELEDDGDWTPYYHELLSVRRRELLDRLAGCQSAGVDILGPAALCARWRLMDGMELSLWLNLGSEAVPCTRPCHDMSAALHESLPGAAAELSAGMLPPLACVATMCEPAAARAR